MHSSSTSPSIYMLNLYASESCKSMLVSNANNYVMNTSNYLNIQSAWIRSRGTTIWLPLYQLTLDMHMEVCICLLYDLWNGISNYSSEDIAIISLTVFPAMIPQTYLTHDIYLPYISCSIIFKSSNICRWKQESGARLFKWYKH